MSNALHIRLYIPNDGSYDASLKDVSDRFEEMVPECWKLEYEEPNFGQEERELVYKMHKIRSNASVELKEKFFTRLQEFFVVFHKYLPSFTQNSHASE